MDRIQSPAEPGSSHLRLVPSRTLGLGLVIAAGLATLGGLAGVPAHDLESMALVLVGLAALVLIAEAGWKWRQWSLQPLQLTRQASEAFALGVRSPVNLTLTNPSPRAQELDVFDGVDPSLELEGLPQRVRVPPGGRLTLSYHVRPTRRGEIAFGPASLRLRTPRGGLELQVMAGAAQTARVYPNFAAVSRYAWLAGDRRLGELGIKSFTGRGEGTEFDQLAEYRVGDPVRHVDWKSSLKHQRPIVRTFRDERDQCVLFLLDCGRRMRADEASLELGGQHFDHVLNALMLLSYVALKEGDEVGLMTFGHAPGEQRHLAPRKGLPTMSSLIGRLYDLEPGHAHPDYLQAARSVLSAHRKRSLVILLTNFRGEDAAELQPALALLRTRHLVLVASLKERALREIAEQPISRREQATEVAAAHLFQQSRREAFQRVTAQDPLALDVEPASLAVELVNRYRSVKRSRRL